MNGAVVGQTENQMKSPLKFNFANWMNGECEMPQTTNKSLILVAKQENGTKKSIQCELKKKNHDSFRAKSFNSYLYSISSD